MLKARVLKKTSGLACLSNPAQEPPEETVLVYFLTLKSQEFYVDRRSVLASWDRSGEHICFVQ